ncbi:uncharacterized protein LOC117931798 isoform X2 [Vitis riparia]|uniref:uncharacterized protein LOC117931798 isoform X2 n=1 Tax=Vitis riparia TaxID=96939 RepID=UPI00155AEFCD|nr:uncharacterized protein LOC117931798 isoform X2 [Vitis riparia]
MEGSDAEELEELEADVKEMAQKVRHYRTTLPDQLKATFTSILSSQRPPFLEFVSGSEPEASGEPNPVSGGCICGACRVEEMGTIVDVVVMVSGSGALL